MELGGAFEQESGLVRVGTIGNATVKLIPQCELVDFAVRWMEKNRKEEKP
jgi:aminoglycoside 3-N-acetyltransferase